MRACALLLLSLSAALLLKANAANLRDQALVNLGGSSRSYLTPQNKLDLRVSVMFAKLTSVAYCTSVDAITNWDCARCGDIPGFELHMVALDADKDVLAYIGYLPDVEAIVIVFRGTNTASLKNWIDNLTTGTTEITYPSAQHPKVRVHTGFLKTWELSTLKPQLEEALEQLLVQYPGVPVYFAGHSLGGALAQLSALEFKFKYDLSNVVLYTFGSPRVGNTQFASLVASSVAASWRFTHNRDAVPSVPLQLMGFHHAAVEVWEVDSKDEKGAPVKKIEVCNDSGEDPKCHISGCNLIGLCTSISDHLVYLDIDMSSGC